MERNPSEIRRARKQLLQTPTGKKLLVTKPESKQELKDWIKLFLGIDVIDRPTCEQHNSQMDYLWHTYQDGGDIIVKANRGGGKTALGAVGTIVDSMLKPGYETRIIGGCLKKGSMIVTAKGLKCISEVQEGEWVLTRSGLRKVAKATQREYSGPLVYLKPYRGMKIGITPEHLVWVVETSKCIYADKPCRPLCKKKHKCRYSGKYSHPKWIPAGQLDKNKHWLLFPKKVIGDTPENQMGLHEPISRFLEIVGAFAGTKVAMTDDSIKFAFIRDARDTVRERLFIEMLTAASNQLFNSRLKKKEIELVINSYLRLSVQCEVKTKEMTAFFESMGKKWQDRHLPYNYLGLDAHRIARILRGITMTHTCDNGRGGGRVKYYIKNPELVGQVYLMFMKLGYLPSIVEPDGRNADPYYRIVMTLADQVDFYNKYNLAKLSPVGISDIRSSRNNSYVMNMGEWHWVSIANIKYQPFKGYVYNLEMEGGDPSYCCPGISVHNSLTQSENMYGYTNIWEAEGYDFYLAEGPYKKYTKLANGSKFSILAQSTKHARGPHIPKIKCDEADEFKPTVWNALQFCSFSDPEYPSSFEILSTSHMRGGIMVEAIKTAEQYKIPIVEWCLMDVLEPCSPDRTCKKKDGKYCILFDDCKGKAKDPKKQGFFPIEDAIKIKQRANKDAWDVEMMLKKPDASGTVYPEFEEKIHVIEDLPFNQSYDTYKAFDFGTTDPFVTLFLQKAPDGVLILVDSLYYEGLAASTVVGNILEHQIKMQVPSSLLNYCDPSGADYRKELEKRGISTIGTQSKKIEGVMAVKERLKIRQDGRPGLLICRRNVRFIKEILTYTKEKFLRGGPDDHGPDALRYFCVNSRLWDSAQRFLTSNDINKPKHGKNPYRLKRPSKKSYNPGVHFDNLVKDH